MKPPRASDAGEEGLFDVFANRVFTIRILTVACLFFMLTSALGPILALYVAHEPERVAVVGDDGTVTIARLQRFKNALAFHKIAATQAARAILNRTPDGIEDTDTIEVMFNQAGRDKLADLIKSQASILKEYGYHQKAEIQSTEIAADPDGSYRARVKGQLIRAGVFNEAPKLDRLSFTLILYLFRNGNADLNRQYPLGVWNFDYSESR
ncbi:MAG TPA: hypothetical protein VG838_08685 [Opitutaceae bacterium]|nr:hypothetical protein [Opitutaceae bacterium]